MVPASQRIVGRNMNTELDQTKTPLEMFYRWESEVPEQVFLRQSLGADGWLEYGYSNVSRQFLSSG